MRPERLRRWAASWWCSCALLLVTAPYAWWVPAGANPDEHAHYTRGLSIGRGELLGDEVPVPPRPDEPTCCEGGNPTAISWVRAGIRRVTVPSDLIGRTIPCSRARLHWPTACGRESPPGVDEEPMATNMGTIAPLAYVPGGLVSHLTNDALWALRFMRLVNAMVFSVVVGAAVTFWWRVHRSVVALVVPALLVTPAVVNVAASASPNAWEVGGGIAFGLTAMAVLHPSPARDTYGRRAHVLLAASGVLLAGARSLGPFWAAMVVVAAVALHGRPAAHAWWRRDRPAAMATVGVVVVAALQLLVWDRLVAPSYPIDLGFAAHEAGTVLVDDGRDVARQVVAASGATNDVPFPGWLRWVWAAMTAALLGGALALGSARERLVVLASVAALPVLLVGFGSLVMHQNGFPVQGRHLLVPVGVAVLAAGEVTARRLGPSPRVLVASAAALGAVAAVQLAAYQTVHNTYVPRSVGVVPLLGDVEVTRDLVNRGSVPLVLGLAVAAAGVVAASRTRRAEPAPAAAPADVVSSAP